jgi:acylphosphatase
MRTINIRVHGRVQGVGFRYFTQRYANAYNIKGWVRNCTDGSVEILAQGDENDLDNFLQIIRKGPNYAGVTHIDSKEVKNPQLFKDFRVTF